MNTKEAAKKRVAELIERFERERPLLDSAPEAQIENDYIRPLFAALNWNVTNTGLSGRQREFILQKTDAGGNRPDYLLRLDDHDLVFVEAKRVKYSMREARWLNQAYSYAYSTQGNPRRRKVDFAVLTDFEELVILDCTFLVHNPTSLLKLRVLNLEYRDYLKHWDEIWELLERDSMAQAHRSHREGQAAGLWNRYLTPQKVSASRIAPDRAFLDSLDNDSDGWRIRLARDLHKQNPKLSGREITAIVQQQLDRLVFTKALADRDIEDDHLAEMADALKRKGLLTSRRDWGSISSNTFGTLNKRYNGSIFTPGVPGDDELSNSAIHSVIADLLPERSPYNLEALPVELLGSIYERFLGRVVAIEGKAVKIEEKPEVRKAGGVYYTPRYVVDFIIQATLGRVLENCRTPDDVAKIKVLDPACGSGSFLVGAYQHLIRWYERYYSGRGKLSRQDSQLVYRRSDGTLRLSARMRRKILLDNIFGADIDEQAVEVTKFSLSLKALEDIRRSELLDELSIFKVSVLPDLSRNIRSGNALIGSDYAQVNPDADRETLHRVRPFDWASRDRGFGDVVAQGGFDVIIGNPPYIKEYVNSQPFRDLKDTKMSSYYEGKMDIWYLFSCLSVDLLRSGGLHAFIATSNWNTAAGASHLRRKLLAETQIIQYVDFGEFRVFQDASIQTMIYVAKKELPKKDHKLPYLRIEDRRLDASTVEGALLEGIRSSGTIEFTASVRASGDGSVFTFVDSSSGPVLQKLERNGTYRLNDADVGTGIDVHQDFVNKRHLEHLKGASVGQGIFVLSNEELESLKLSPAELRWVRPYYTTNELGRYYGHKRNRLWVLYMNSEAIGMIDDLPRLKRHFDRLAPVITSDSAPYGLHRARDERLFVGEKLISLRKTMAPCVTYTAFDCYVSQTYFVIKPSKIDLKYLCGVLNSSIVHFWLLKKGKLQGEQLQVDKAPLLTIPIPEPKTPQQKAAATILVKNVEGMLRMGHELRTLKLESQRETVRTLMEAGHNAIDATVGQLYGLDERELKLIQSVVARRLPGT